MINRNQPLSIGKQARLLGMSRSAVYYLQQPTSAAELALMRAIDELHLEFPFMGSQQLRRHLLKRGHKVARLHVRTLMKQVGIAALAPQPGTSERNPRHKLFPTSSGNCPSFAATRFGRWTQPISAWSAPLST